MVWCTDTLYRKSKNHKPKKGELLSRHRLPEKPVCALKRKIPAQTCRRASFFYIKVLCSSIPTVKTVLFLIRPNIIPTHSHGNLWHSHKILPIDMFIDTNFPFFLYVNTKYLSYMFMYKYISGYFYLVPGGNSHEFIQSYSFIMNWLCPCDVRVRFGVIK